MSKIFFTSDYHLNHGNIIKYCNRPFKNVDHMNSEIIRRHNERVKPEDVVFHMGDFCFYNSPGGKPGEGGIQPGFYWEQKLNGKIIHILGNHDRNNKVRTKIFNLTLLIGGTRINLVHKPEHSNNLFKLNLTGHVHNNWLIKRIETGFGFTDCFNVGVDMHNFYPITYEEINKQYARWAKKKAQNAI